MKQYWKEIKTCKMRNITWNMQFYYIASKFFFFFQFLHTVIFLSENHCTVEPAHSCCSTMSHTWQLQRTDTSICSPTTHLIISQLTLKFANRAYIVQIAQGISVLYLNICYCCKLGFSDNIFVNLVMGKNVRANQEWTIQRQLEILGTR
jgi:hypothetical protein